MTEDNDFEWGSDEIPPAFRNVRSSQTLDHHSVHEPEVPTLGPPDHPRQFPARFKLAIGLFVATCLTTWVAGTLVCGIPGSGTEWQVGLQYSLALMTILLCHEMGHYLQARRYGVPATLPYFIPVPPPFIFGTMGAVILQGAGVANRKSLYDIAISGPLAGLVIALPVAWLGVLNAKMVAIPPNFNGMIFGDPLILQWMVEAVHGPRQAGMDVDLSGNPLLFAGWVGIFITGLNLVPIGQLDGGHVLYTLIGRRAHWVAMGLLASIVGWMGYTGNYAFVVMVLLLLMMGPRHPPTADDRVPIGPLRTILGWLTLSFVFVGLTPAPLTVHAPEVPVEVIPGQPADEVVPGTGGGDEKQESSPEIQTPPREVPDDPDKASAPDVASAMPSRRRSDRAKVLVSAACSPADAGVQPGACRRIRLPSSSARILPGSSIDWC